MILEFGSYRAKVIPGNNQSAIISIAGVGRPEADTERSVAMAFEWERTLRRLQRQDHIIFIQDTGRSWFNAPNGWVDLIGFINDYLKNNLVSTKVAIGLSMGGAGAIILDRHIRFDKVVALSPQALIACNLCPWDDRFTEFRGRIERFKFPDTARMIRVDGNYDFLFSYDDPTDMHHASIFRERTKNVRLFAVRGAHNIGVEMARRGSLDRFVEEMLDSKTATLRQFGVFKASNQMFELIETHGAVDRCQILNWGRSRPFELPSYFYDVFHYEMVKLQLLSGCSYRQAHRVVPYPAHVAQVIDGDRLQNFAIEGWSQPDNWSIGRDHVIRLRLMDLNLFPDARMEMTLEPLLHHQHRHQRVRVEVNGCLAADRVVHYDPSGENTFSISIGRLSPVMEIAVITPDCIAPARLEMNPDVRELGVRLIDLRLFPY
jgi:hypothetical protein